MANVNCYGSTISTAGGVVPLHNSATTEATQDEIRTDGDEVILTIDPITPILSKKVLELLDETLSVISEYRLSIRKTQKGWKNNLNVVRYYLDRLLKTCDEF